MSTQFNCSEFCPVYRECKVAQAIWETTNNSLATQAGYIASAVEQASLAEIYGAMAIATGEITAEQAEEQDRALDELRIIKGKNLREDLSEQLARIPEEQAQADEFKAAIDSVTTVCTEASEQCSGLELTAIGRILEAISKARYFARTELSLGSSKRLYKDMHDRHRETDRINHYLEHGRCGSVAVRAAFKRSDLKSFYKK